MLHSATASQDECKYRVKIINPKAKKDVIVIDWRGVGDKFKNPIELKQKLIDTLGKYVPPASAIDDFSVGYLHGRPQTKSWILCEEDLIAMYDACDKDIFLWCDGKSLESSSGRKRKSDGGGDATPATKKVTQDSSDEDELEKLVDELQKTHKEKYNYSQCKLWARMIKNRQWNDKETPPNLPMITGRPERKEKKDLSDSLANAAVAIVHALQSPTNAGPMTPPTQVSEGIFPGKKVHLRSQYLKQLKDIQNLRDEGILTPVEFQREKDTILRNLGTLS